MKEVTLTRISVTDKDKEGKPLEGKFGPFFKVGIQTEEHTDDIGNPVWINALMNKRPDWEVGAKLTIDVYEKEYKGAKYLNFKVPKIGQALEERLKRIEDAVFGDKKAPEPVDDFDDF